MAMQMVHILRYLKAWLIPRAKTKALFHFTSSGIVIVTIIIITSTVDDACAFTYCGIYLGIWFAETVAYFSSWYVIKTEPKISLPINVPHVAERFGLFVMLILGESIISVISADLGDIELGKDGDYYDRIRIVFVVRTIRCFFLVWSHAIL